MNFKFKNDLYLIGSKEITNLNYFKKKKGNHKFELFKKKEITKKANSKLN